ncbi:MAG: hypothetical protein RQ801_10435, partial [Spirochaetaceae bacterium]|nr:hypothetical protein [Spirochaetaceae bacterium]
MLAPVLPLLGFPGDAAGPSLVLSILEEGGTYSETIRISGKVVPSPDEGQGDNRVDTLSWSVPELDDSGYIMFHRSGEFSRSIPVRGARIPLTLILTLIDRAGRRDIRTIRFTYTPEVVETEEVKPEEEPPPPDVPLPENPVIIESPRDGDVYRSVVNVSGRVAGEPIGMSWVAEELGAQGPIEIGEDGGFHFAFSTAGFSATLMVRVIAEYPERKESVSITLTNARIGPYLGVDVPEDGGFYGDELEVSGVVGRDSA